MSQQTQHTPGPWTVNGYAIETEGKDALFVASVMCENNTWGNVPISCATASANARLIAAAPELLAELREIADGWEQAAKVRRLNQWEQERLEFARAAIAKAQGK